MVRGGASTGAAADHQLVLEQQRFGDDRADTAGARKLRQGDDQLHREEKQVTHRRVRLPGISVSTRLPIYGLSGYDRRIRTSQLETFVFEQVRAAMLRPQMLLAGESAIAKQRKPTGDEFLGAEVSRFNRKIEAVCAERRRIVDLYQAALIDQSELMRRGEETDLRRRALEAQREALVGERNDLAQKNRLRQRVAGFAEKIAATIDKRDFEQRQRLLRLVVEQVLVKGWQVQIKLRVPLDTPPDPPGNRLSTKDRLRSLHGDDDGVAQQTVEERCGNDRVAEDFSPLAEAAV